MAKVTAPLFSEEAHGKLAKALVYQNRYGKPSVRTIGIYPKKKSLIQEFWRQGFREIMPIMRQLPKELYWWLYETSTKILKEWHREVKVLPDPCPGAMAWWRYFGTLYSRVYWPMYLPPKARAYWLWKAGVIPFPFTISGRAGMEIITKLVAIWGYVAVSLLTFRSNPDRPLILDTTQTSTTDWQPIDLSPYITPETRTVVLKLSVEGSVEEGAYTFVQVRTPGMRYYYQLILSDTETIETFQLTYHEPTEDPRIEWRVGYYGGRPIRIRIEIFGELRPKQ